MSYTLASDGTVAVKDTNATMMDKVTNAVGMYFASTDVLHTTEEVRYFGALNAAAGLIGGSVYARKRAAEGKAPIAKILF